MWLPPSVKDKAIAVDSERLNQAVSCVLCAADGACDENELSVALKMIGALSDTFVEALGSERQGLVEALRRIRHYDTLSPSFRAKIVTLIVSLLEKKHLKVNIEVDWRPLFDEVVALTYGESLLDIHAASLSFTSNYWANLMHLVGVLRQFFPADDVPEIVDACMEYMTGPLSFRLIMGQGLLAAFLPPSISSMPVSEICAAWLDQWLDIWDWVDACNDWNTQWFNILARATRHADPHGLLWGPRLPRLYSKIQLSFGLAAGQGSAPTGLKVPDFMRMGRVCMGSRSNSFSIAKYTAKLVVRTLCSAREEPDGQMMIGMDYLRRLLMILRTYFYPSNSGRYSGRLGVFVRFLCSTFSKRIGFERTLPDDDPHRLPNEVKRRFLEILLPLMRQGLFSRSPMLRQGCGAGIMRLAWIAPYTIVSDIIPTLADTLSPDAINQSHQAPTGLATLGCIMTPLLRGRPVLADQLVCLLEAALPGLDANDIIKSLSTLVFYLLAMTCVPPVSDISTIPDRFEPADNRWERDNGLDSDDVVALVEGEDGVFQAAWAATAGLEDWAIRAVEQLLQLLKNSDGADIGGKLSGMVHCTAQLIFGQVSPSTFDICLRKLYDFFTRHFLLSSVSFVRALLRSAVTAYPKKVLDMFVPFALRGLKSVISDDVQGNGVEGAIERELRWHLIMLCGCMYSCGPAVLPHADKIMSVLSVTLLHRVQSVRNEALQVLYAMMMGLLGTYPRDICNSTVCNGPDSCLELHKNCENCVSQLPSWQHWGERRAWMSLNAEYHEPSVDERELAMSLLQRFCLDYVQCFDEIISEDQSEPRESHFWKARLASIYFCLSMCAPFLAEMGDFDDKVMPVGCVAFDFDGKPVRKQILECTRRVIEYLKDRDEQIDAVKYAVKSMWVLLDCRVREMHHTFSAIFGESTSNGFTNEISRAFFDVSLEAEIRARAGFPVQMCHSSRPFMVSNVYYGLSQRMFRRGAELPYWLHMSGEYDESCWWSCLWKLFESSAHGYLKVRLDAHRCLCGVLVQRPWMAVAVIDKLLCEKFEEYPVDDVAAREEGSSITLYTALWRFCHVLKKRWFLRRVTRNWELLSRTMLRICSIGEVVEMLTADRSQKAHRDVHLLFLRLLKVMLPRNLRDIDKKSYEDLIGGLLELIGGYGKGKCDRQEENEFAEFVDTVNCLHWRYELMVYACLRSLVREDVPCDGRVYLAFAKGISRDLPALRLISRNGLLSALEFRKQDWGMDDGVVEYLMDVNFLRDLADSMARDRKEAQWYVNHVADAMTELIWNGSGADGEKLFSGPRMSPDIAKLLGVCNVPIPGAQRILPLARVSQLRAVQRRNCRLMNRICVVIGARRAATVLYPIIDSFLSDSVAAEEEKLHCIVAAEMITGVMTAFGGNEMDGSSDSVDGAVAELWEIVTPLLKHGLSRLSLKLSVPWMDALLLIASVQSIQQMQPFIEYLLDECRRSLLESLSPRSAVLFSAPCKWLSFVGSICVEMFAKSMSHSDVETVDWLCQSVIEVVLSAKSHPFNAVRDKVALMILLVMQKYATCGRQEWNRELLVKLGVCERGVDLGESDDVLSGSSDKVLDSEENRRREEMLMCLLLKAINCGNVTSIAPIIVDLLPIAIRCTSSTNVDLLGLAVTCCREVQQGLRLSPDLDLDLDLEDSGGCVGNIESVIRCMERMSGFDLWHSRVAVLQFIAAFRAYHAFALTPGQDKRLLGIVRLMIDLLKHYLIMYQVVFRLGDKRKEVQDEAKDALRGIVMTMDEGRVVGLADQFLKKTRDKLTRRRKLRAGVLATRYAGVLGLCAIIQSQPYDVPEFLVPLLVRLSGHLDDPPPICTVVREVFTDFRRTHQDTWQRERHKFTSEEWEAVNDMLISPYYYA